LESTSVIAQNAKFNNKVINDIIEFQFGKSFTIFIQINCFSAESPDMPIRQIRNESLTVLFWSRNLALFVETYLHGYGSKLMYPLSGQTLHSRIDEILIGEVLFRWLVSIDTCLGNAYKELKNSNSKTLQAIHDRIYVARLLKSLFKKFRKEKKKQPQFFDFIYFTYKISDRM
jgi:hypothetical protein